MKKAKPNNRMQIRLQSKRNVELWVYSFADMYMILSVFFITISVIFAAQVKEKSKPTPDYIPSAGRGPSAVESQLALSFDQGHADLNESSVQELKLLLPIMRELKGSMIDVEGYADKGRLTKGAPFSSNLDLSNRRAVRVAEWLINNGVAAHRVRTFAYGDSKTWDKSIVNTNRRVVIKMSNQSGVR